MTPATQVKLLRVLQERTLPPARRPHRAVGRRPRDRGDQHRSGRSGARQGKLREDLYYRLNVFAFRLPTLRERKEDLPLLVQAFINEFNTRNQKSIAGRRSAGDADARAATRGPATCASCATSSSARRFSRRGRSSRRSTCRRSLAEEPQAPHQPQVALAPGTTVEEAERRLIMMTLAAHARQQDARRGNPRHQPEDAAQQVEQAAAATEKDGVAGSGSG